MKEVYRCNLCGCSTNKVYAYIDYIEGAPWEAVGMVHELIACIKCDTLYHELNDKEW